MITERTAAGYILLTCVVVALALWATVAPADLYLNAVLLLGVLVGLWLGVWLAVNVRLNVPIAVVIYALATIGWKIGRRVQVRVRRMRGKESGFKLAVPQRRVAANVHEVEGLHRLGPYDVVLGYHRGRPIKHDMTAGSILVAGSSGGGKTVGLQVMLCGLFVKPNFHDDVYVVDLKNSVRDHLAGWKPLLKRYVDNVDDALDLFDDMIVLMNQRHRLDWGDKKRGGYIWLFADEIADLTSDIISVEKRREAIVKMTVLAKKARDAGIIFTGATQYPKFDVLPKPIVHNMLIKICYVVDDYTQAEVVLTTRPARLLTQPGEFWMRGEQPGLVQGRGLLIDRPHDIDKIVMARLTNFQDWRLDYLRRCCANIPLGKSLPGVRSMEAALRTEGLEWSIEDMTDARRHYALSGALVPPKERGSVYTLKVPYVEALGLVATYIRDGKWTESPAAFVKMVGTNKKTDGV